MRARLLDGYFAGREGPIMPNWQEQPPQFLEALIWAPSTWITFDVGAWEGDIRYQYTGQQDPETGVYLYARLAT
jgi:hypothetical protein